MFRRILRLKPFLVALATALLCLLLLVLVDQGRLPDGPSFLTRDLSPSVRLGARHPAGILPNSIEETSDAEFNVKASFTGGRDKSTQTRMWLEKDEGSDLKALEDEDSESVLSRGIYDWSRQYKLLPFVYAADSSFWEKPLCMSTQVSFDRLGDLDELSSYWNGPISVVVYTPDVEFALAREAISILRLCQENIRKKVTFHMVTDAEHPPVTEMPEEYEPDVASQHTCKDLKETLLSLQKLRPDSMMKWRDSLAYPQNVLRNFARTTCPGKYVYTPDADMLTTSKDAYENILEFLGKEEQNNCEKCAYVLPVYEINEKVKALPTSKPQLLKLIAEKRARIFHATFAPKNSASSNLTYWQTLPALPDEKISVAYKVTKYMIGYEPVYIANASVVPKFDERFKGYGSTRYTQAFEMQSAGFQFQVLDNVFLCHRGFQTLKSRPKWRAAQQVLNNQLVLPFAKEVITRYGGKDPYHFVSFAKGVQKISIPYAGGMQHSPGVRSA